MAITLTTLEQKASRPAKIYVTQPDGIDLSEVRASLAHLAGTGQITDRDEALLETLREVGVMSLDQIRRLLWPAAKERTAYNRLYLLVKHHLLAYARVPRVELTPWGLAVRNVYGLGAGGWLWLKQEVNRQVRERHLHRDQVLHDLLVTELYVRLVETVRRRQAGWDLTWHGEQGASFYPRDRQQPLLEPDGLALLRGQLEAGRPAVLPFFIELDRSREAHGRPSSDWGRKIAGYQQFYTADWKLQPQLAGCPTFPLVVIVTHGAQRLLNLTESILRHRREPLTYQLALWDDLVASDDMLAAPIWLVITPEGRVIGREAGKRLPLVRA